MRLSDMLRCIPGLVSKDLLNLGYCKLLALRASRADSSNSARSEALLLSPAGSTQVASDEIRGSIQTKRKCPEGAYDHFKICHLRLAGTATGNTEKEEDKDMDRRAATLQNRNRTCVDSAIRLRQPASS